MSSRFDNAAQAREAARTKCRRVQCPKCRQWYGGIARHIAACHGGDVTAAIRRVGR